MTPLQLPPEWLVRVSRAKGKLYYYHTLTKKTQWSRPTSTEIAAANVVQEKIKEVAYTGRDNKRQKHDSPVDAILVDHKTSVFRALIASSMRVGGSSISRGTKKTVVFTPWPHQLTAVENVITAIQTRMILDDKSATNTESFLLQHSTGAGKTLTIAALTHQLLHVKDALSMQFHTIVVMLDRVTLNEQVGDVVEMYLRRNGVDEVFRAESIDHLAKLLDVTTTPSPQRVIITTTHKMGLLVKNDVLLTRLLYCSSHSKLGPDADDGEAKKENMFQRVAIITDEAHRSHSSSTREAIGKVLKSGEGSRAHLTFIGFTATPNFNALELFGSQTKDAFRHPFHCYPIAEAAADGRILNIVDDYTCVGCDVETSVFPRPVHEFLQKHCSAHRRLLDYASDDVAVLKAKALIMMTDFQNVKREHPKVKCMVVVRSRQDVVRYYKLITTFVAKRKTGWNCYASFSGSVMLDVKSVTEQTLNQQSVTLAISDIVIVCDKLDTGYNEPLLACMYVDRYLRTSTHTVQVLSRLNRRHRHKPSARVLDFANHPAQVRQSFANFWRETRVPKSAITIDALAEKKNVVTAVTILCDFFPELCACPIDIEDPRSFVEKRMLPLERDAFQQVLDALRGAVLAYRRLGIADCAHYFDFVAPFSHELLLELKKETEKYVVAVEEDVELSLNNILAKMSARVQSYCKTFAGAFDPQSLLHRVECEMMFPETVSCLLQSGKLELFEAFLALSAARNKRKTLDSCAASQVVEASLRYMTSSASTEGSVKEEPRISARISVLRNELTLYLRNKR